jgi:hypothetical protein
MSKITLDAALRSKLNGLNESIEICDEGGETVGHFLPASAYRKLLYQIAESQCPHTPEQLQARRQQTGGQSLADIWKELEKA